jgi:iron complex outermembrane recepter protein
MKPIAFTLGASAAGAALLMLAPPAVSITHAQNAEADGRHILEEITVTSRRREESALEIPLAVTALSDEDLQVRGVRDMTTLSDFTPGFHFNNENLGRNDRGFTTLTFRGMDAGTFLVTRQPAQAFLDGVAIAGGNIPGLQDIQRVEVIKGPQSAYFGRSTFSGAINFITKDPNHEWGGRLNAEAASFGTFGTFDNSLMVEGPIWGDKAAFRLTGRQYKTDGQYDNYFDGSKLGARKTESLATTFVIEPTDRLKIKGYAGYWEDRDGPAADTITGAEERNCDPLGVGQPVYVCGPVPYRLKASDISKYTIVDEQFRRNILQNQAGLANVFHSNFIESAGLARNAWQTTLSVGYEFENGISLDFSGGYNENAFQAIPGGANYPATPSELTPNPNYGIIPGVRQYAEWNQSLVNQANHAHSLEARLTSDDAQAFRWMVGASLFAQEAQGRSFGESITGFGDSALVTDRDVRTSGVFTGLAYDFTDQITLNVEARYQWDDVSSQVIDGPGGPGATTGPEFQDVFKSFQPRVILEYAPVPEINIYTSVAKGSRPGDFNANLDLFSAADKQEIIAELGSLPETLDQEEIVMYELGMKGRFFNDVLRGAIAVYYGDWTNQHVFTNLTLGDTGGGTGRGIDITTSSGESTVKGVELEGTALLTDAFTADFTFAYTRTVLGDSYTCPTCLPLIGSRDVAGNQKARVPETSGTLGLTYSRPLNDVYDMNVRLDYLYKGTIYADDANLAETGDSHKMNASVSFRNEALTITVYGTNLFNDKTFPSMSAGVNSYDRGTPVAGYPLGPGRAIRISLPDKPTLGVRMSYDF